MGYHKCRILLLAEISGNPDLSLSPDTSTINGMSAAKAARQRRAEEARRQVELLSKQMESTPDKLPDDYYILLEKLPPKFTTEVQEQDEWRNAGTRPMQEYYNNLAGRDIDTLRADKSVKFDSYQNPLGSQFDLPREGTMQEHTLVLFWFSDQGSYKKPVEALRSKGFRVVTHNARTSTVQQMMVSLLNADVVWIVSGASVTQPGFEQFLDALEFFHRRGGGLFIWADNAPYFAHANQLLMRLFPSDGIYLEGNDEGGQVMRAHTDGLTPGHLTTQHLIMTGLFSLFEGVTISHLTRVGSLKVLATYNNGPSYGGKAYSAVADGDVYKRCKAPYRPGRGRIAIDGGFTKLYDEYWDKTAGTERYVKNASAWLLNMNSRIASEQDATCVPADLTRTLPQTPAPPPASVRNGARTYRSASQQAYIDRLDR